MGELITKLEVCSRLGISESSFERMVRRGEGPRATLRPRHGNRPQSLYDAEEVERIRQKSIRTQVLKPGDPRLPVPSPVPAVAAVTQPLDLTPVAAAFRAGFSELRAGFSEIAQALKRPDPDPYLTVEEAAKRKGIPAGLMLRFIQAKRIRAVKYGRWRVRRSLVDSLDVELALAEVRKAAEELRAFVRKAVG